MGRRLSKVSFWLLLISKTYSLQGTITKMIPSGFLSAPFHSMPSSILPKVSAVWDLSGVIGPFQWKGMVAMKSSQESPAAAFHIQSWINMSCKKHASANWASSTTFQRTYHWNPQKRSSIPSLESVSLYYSHVTSLLTQSRPNL